MTARPFIDTNILIYAESADGEKSAKALSLLEHSPVISTQVVNECIVVLVRKYAFSLSDACEVAESVMSLCEVTSVDVAVVDEAIRLGNIYSLSHWDALIVAAAMLAGCDTLYTEDLQHGQMFGASLRVVNPFLQLRKARINLLMSNPVVFISYSHDSDAHREKVLALSERLRQDGVDTRLDRYPNGTPLCEDFWRDVKEPTK